MSLNFYKHLSLRLFQLSSKIGRYKFDAYVLAVQHTFIQQCYVLSLISIWEKLHKPIPFNGIPFTLLIVAILVTMNYLISRNITLEYLLKEHSQKRKGKIIFHDFLMVFYFVLFWVMFNLSNLLMKE